jgi:hypothetical protein
MRLRSSTTTFLFAGGGFALGGLVSAVFFVGGLRVSFEARFRSTFKK